MIVHSRISSASPVILLTRVFISSVVYEATYTLRDFVTFATLTTFNCKCVERFLYINLIKIISYCYATSRSNFIFSRCVSRFQALTDIPKHKFISMSEIAQPCGQASKSLLSSIRAKDMKGVEDAISMLKKAPACCQPSCPDPVCAAAEAEDDAIFNLLLHSGFDPDRYSSPNNCGSIVRLKPLHIAACRGNVQFSKRLIESHNLSVDSQDNKGKTPLIWAVYRKRSLMMQYLISKGADVNHSDSSGVTPLFLAVSKTHTKEMMKLLIDAGSDVNVKVRSRSLFYKAAVIGRLDMAKLLYDRGARLEPECAELWTRRDIKLIKFLIEINAPQGDPADVELAPMYLGSLTSESLERSHQWLDLLIDTGHFISVIDWDNVCDKLIDENFERLKNKLKYHMCNPKSLQEICVFRIRKILGSSLPKDVDCLPLPVALRKRVRHEHLFSDT